MERGKVWLGVCAVVENRKGEWLVVKKSYSGLMGRWSLPAGFVNEGETVDSAAIREVKEETGIDCVVKGLIGFRSGVIRDEISDNMAIFLCELVDHAQPIIIQEREITEAHWISPVQLAEDPNSSIMLMEMAKHRVEMHRLDKIEGIDPGPIFEYTQYKLFMKR